ncbi:hypothetical protein C1I95_28880 [Micromonospora craterilacus]|uniref:Chromosome partitioning protein n=1 Tax=Micromonospora craterilacus TaxID=1655439 RepID=A0A2W2E7P4_9ACTN|nr:hypothetical protein [Micromonospora craterilacus]PZG09560.1 hypothetical protein C1I95_28880 [Micromonospora craterilacus]
MLVVVASVSGAAGVSTAALGLAALWPNRKGLLVEADPCGGVVAARFGLPQEPGLAGLAAAARHGLPAGGSARFVQVLPVGVHTVVGPGAAETAAGAVSVLAGQPQAVAALAPVVVVDAGRLYPGSPAHGLLGDADALVVVTAGDTEHLDHVEHRLAALRTSVRGGAVGLAVCGKTPFEPHDISTRCRAPVWAHLPRDRWGAAALSGRMTGPAWTRTRLAQALRSLAATLAVPARPARPSLEVLR